MNLDIQTLSIVSVVFSLLSAIGTYVFGRSQLKFKGFGYFSLSYVAIVFGFILLSLRGILPDFVTVIIANFFIVLSVILVFEAISVFFGEKPGNNYYIYLFLLIYTGLFVYFTYISHSINMRIVFISLILLILRGFCIQKFWKNKNEELNAPIIFGVLILAIVAGYDIVRIMDALLGGEIHDFFQADSFQGLAYLFTQIQLIGLPFVFIWMVSVKLETELKSLAMIDGLTGIYNRRGIQAMMERELSQVVRNKSDISLIFLDIDEFKQINDQNGHVFGDKVLNEIAKSLSSQLRMHDILGRYGGEEFVIVLPGSRLDLAVKVAERIREFISQQEFEIQHKKLRLTVSLGVSSCNYADPNCEKMIDRADDLMYQAKRLGKNRVEFEIIPNNG